MKKSKNSKRQPVIAYVVPEDWAFLKNRLPVSKAAHDEGFDVHVITNISNKKNEIEKEGFTVHEIVWDRGGINPFDALRQVARLRKYFKSIKPDLVHLVALRSIVFGALASIGLEHIRIVANVTGFGFIYSSPTLKARLLRIPITTCLRLLLNRKSVTIIVQNPDDDAEMKKLGIGPDRIIIIPGSGVDTSEFSPTDEPRGRVKLLFVGRMIADKGVGTLVEAVQSLNLAGNDIHCVLVGDSDFANPTAILPAQLEEWSKCEFLTFTGFRDDIASLLSETHIAVLPSRREGFPKVLLEAASCAKPVIATDVPGCREITKHGVNGLLVAVDDSEALRLAIEELAANSEMRHQFGRAGRKLVEEKFSDRIIGEKTLILYKKVLGTYQ